MSKSTYPAAKPRLTQKIIALCISLALAPTLTVHAQDAANTPTLAAKSAVVFDATDQAWITLDHPDDQLYPASLTKMLTAILLVETKQPGDVLTASSAAAGQEPSNISLHAGEKLTAQDCLYAMMLQSANDVAYMAAENVGGSIPKFAILMNDRAKAIGMTHSHFVTPNGLHDENHYSTARDMALLMQEALKHPEIAAALKTKSYKLHRSYEPSVMTNQNEMLSDPDSLGGKSGFTDQAGSCLIEAANKKGHELIAVNLKDPTKKDMYADSAALLSNAYDQFQPFNKSAADPVKTWISPLGIHYEFRLAQSYTSQADLRSEDVSTKITLNQAPALILPGAQAGTLHLYNKDKEIAAIPLIAAILPSSEQASSPLASACAITFLLALLLAYNYLLALGEQKKTPAVVGSMRTTREKVSQSMPN
ncbi:MAG: hypothetical protein JWN30_2116 [Bacilli bacterium]|nr:hypothetical protein [Bacilli bacterium]